MNPNRQQQVSSHRLRSLEIIGGFLDGQELLDECRRGGFQRRSRLGRRHRLLQPFGKLGTPARVLATLCLIGGLAVANSADFHGCTRSYA